MYEKTRHSEVEFLELLVFFTFSIVRYSRD
jgi:hypothetical protein